MITLNMLYVEEIVRMALNEDIGSGDITTLLTIPLESKSIAVMTAKADGIIAGIEIVKTAFLTVNSDLCFENHVIDGVKVSKGTDIATISGNTRSILTAERVALNFVQRMSGIATLTSEFVEETAHTYVKIVDTRKTTPGLRQIEKYAVTIGGGFNHRFGLSDGILIKDNHIAASGGIKNAIKSAKQSAPHTLKIEIEVRNLDELKEAIESGADVVMLDNMNTQTMKEAVKITDGKVLLEASGGVNLETVNEIAQTGIDIISVGALTHSAKALDISLNIKVK